MQFYVLLYNKQAGISGISQMDFVDRKLISGILAYSTFEISHSLFQMYHRQE